MSSFNDRILQHLEQHRQQSVATQKQIDHAMKIDLENQENFRVAANRILTEIIRPRLGELTRHFENAVLLVTTSNQGTACYCAFTHSVQFPATVSLRVSLLPCEVSSDFLVHYDLEILPVFMEYRRNDTLRVPLLNSDDSVIQWVDDKLLEFLDTYLKIEIHPLYQKDNLVLDPVCGMRIPLTAVACQAERNGRAVYFCSEHCREAYLKR